MIKNQNQLRVAQRKMEELRRAIHETSEEIPSTLRELSDEIAEEIDEYLSISNGEVNAFNLESLDELGDVLVKCRLARSLTQSQLAERLGVSEQMVQRDEAGAYERAGMARVADVLDVLGYSLTGRVEPSEDRDTPRLYAHEQVSSSVTLASILDTTYNHFHSISTRRLLTATAPCNQIIGVTVNHATFMLVDSPHAAPIQCASFGIDETAGAPFAVVAQ